MYQKVLKSKIVKGVLILLLLLDVAYSFKQHSSLPLDGDIAPIVVPDPHYQDVLKDPLGFKLLSEPREYPATNRYFSHISMIVYFKNIHSVIEPFFQDKVKCIYFMQGFFNTSIQVLLLCLIAILVLGHFKFWQNDFLWVVLFITPFFQTHGLASSIGIIDKSITYTFFYAFPLALLLIYFLPFYLSFYHKKPIKQFFKLILYPIWIFLAIFLSFSGSIIAPIVLLCSPFIILWMIIQQIEKVNLPNLIKGFFQLPKPFLFAWTWLFVLCIYSFYIGQFNAESYTDVGLLARYKFLLKGLPQFFFHKITFIVIAILLIVNVYLIQSNEKLKWSKNTKRLLLLVAFICVFYIFLLPLGGYRAYRPWIIRYDTFMPITLLIISLTIMSSWTVFHFQLKENKIKLPYLALLFGVLIFFTVSDNPAFHLNDCQNDALHQIQASNESIILLENDCTVLRWSKIKHPENSKVVGDVLHIWGITENPVLFYQE